MGLQPGLDDMHQCQRGKVNRCCDQKRDEIAAGYVQCITDNLRYYHSTESSRHSSNADATASRGNMSEAAVNRFAEKR